MINHENADILLRVENLKVSFGRSAQSMVDAVKGISFSLARHQTVALVGESGSGKSVCSLAIMGLLPQAHCQLDANSRIIFEGRDLLRLKPAERRQICGKHIAMIFQDPMSSLNPLLTVGYQIAEVLILHMNLSARQARARGIALLIEVGIPNPQEKFDAYPHQMSGGQLQRVMIAMAIACEPQLLIADEPTTALDVTIQKQIVELIAQLCTKRGMAVLFITHDLALVKQIADTVIVMRYGEILEVGRNAAIFSQAKHPYTNALLRCRPRMDERPWHLPVIEDFLGKREAATGPAPMSQQRQRGVQGSETCVLEARDLRKTFYQPTGFFSKKVFHAVDAVSFQVMKGKTLGIVGESGSGKTTLGLMLVRLHEASGGQLWFKGQDLLALSSKAFLPMKRSIQIIFQNPYASLNPRMTIGQIIMEPMQIHRIGSNDIARAALAFDWLRKVGLPEQAFYRYPHEFSGGQRQRIAIARCLSMSPEILICDESVSALDVSVQAQILNLLQDLQDELGLSYIFISHDLAVVKYMADKVMVMQGGKVVELGNADELYENPKHPYTQSLLTAMPALLESRA